MFGEHVNIQYCFYHLTQSIWRKIQSLGLTNLYESNDDFHLFCGQIDALAFLPVDEVSEGMAFLRESAPDEAAPLLEYFDTTYVTGHIRPRPQNQDLQLRFRVSTCPANVSSSSMEYARNHTCRPTKDQQCIRGLERQIPEPC